MKITMKINSKGMTLIEVIVAMAILGIIIVSFLTTFTFSFTQIAMSGSISKAVFKAQRATDKEIAGVASIDDSTINTEQKIITINLPYVTDDIVVAHEGKVITTISNSNGKESNIWTFIP